MTHRKRRERLRRRQKTQEQRCKAKVNRRISEIEKTLATEAEDKDFERTRDELEAAQRDLQELLLNTRHPIVGALVVWIINLTTQGITVMNIMPREKFPPGTFKILNRYTGRNYRQFVHVVTKVIFRQAENIEA